MGWILALVAGAYLLSRTGALSSLGIAARTLYTLTSDDINTIASHYNNGSSTFTVHDAGGVSYTLGQAMHSAIANLQIEAYTGDTYCNGTGANPVQGDAIAGMAAGQIATGVQVAESLAKSAGAAVAQVGGALASAVPIVGTVVSVFTAVLGFISAHHAAAVALENKILCPLLPALNGAYQHVIAQMRAGATGADIMQAVQTIQAQAHQVIAQDAGSGALNAVGEEVDAITEAFALIVQKSGI